MGNGMTMRFLWAECFNYLELFVQKKKTLSSNALEKAHREWPLGKSTVYHPAVIVHPSFLSHSELHPFLTKKIKKKQITRKRKTNQLSGSTKIVSIRDIKTKRKMKKRKINQTRARSSTDTFKLTFKTVDLSLHVFVWSIALLNAQNVWYDGAQRRYY